MEKTTWNKHDKKKYDCLVHPGVREKLRVSEIDSS